MYDIIYTKIVRIVNSAIKSPFEFLFEPNIVRVSVGKNKNREENLVRLGDNFKPK